MDSKILEKYIKAGRIAAEAREASRQWVKKGALLIDIAEKIEALIREKGGEPAFPVNLSLNDIAAHYTPTKNDETAVRDGDVLKVDIGVHVDGYVGDTAYTVCFNEKYHELVKASEKALEEALKLCTPSTLLSDISATIEKTIKEFGFSSVSNLTGHGLAQYEIHTEPTVPNVAFVSDYKLVENQVIAIEPFATDGAGAIKESEPAVIFAIQGRGPVRNPDARKILGFAENLNGLPFAERWLPVDSRIKARLALQELRQRGLLVDFGQLKEIKSGIVSQAEHTVIVKDEPVVTTR